MNTDKLVIKITTSILLLHVVLVDSLLVIFPSCLTSPPSSPTPWSHSKGTSASSALCSSCSVVGGGDTWCLTASETPAGGSSPGHKVSRFGGKFTVCERKVSSVDDSGLRNLCIRCSNGASWQGGWEVFTVTCCSSYLQHKLPKLTHDHDPQITLWHILHYFYVERVNSAIIYFTITCIYNHQSIHHSAL